MSDATAPDPPAAPAPDVDEPLAHDGPIFVTNGIIRFRMGDRVVRVRRPFLGELKMLRMALAATEDEISLRSEDARVQGNAMIGEGKELQRRLGAKEISEDDYKAAAADLARRDRDAATGLDEWREQRMLDWWTLVFSGDGEGFRGLAMDPVPDQLEWPVWILDGGSLSRPSLITKCLTHWRTVPTGPG